MSERTTPHRLVPTRPVPFPPDPSRPPKGPQRPVRSRIPSGSSPDLPPLVAGLLDRRRVPCVVELFGPTEGEVYDLASSHPLERLLGSRPRHRVEGLAVLAAGRVLDTSGTGSITPHPAGERLGGVTPGAPVWIAQVIWRDGTAVASLVGLDASGAPGPIRPFVSSCGPIPDAMRRALDLPTPPPSTGPHGYWFLAWLSAVADASATDPLDVAAWHPGIDPRELDAGELDDDLASFCIDRLAEHAAITGWEGIRRCAVEGWLDIGSCEPSLATWFDDGSFSRHVLGQLVEPADALDRLAPSLPSETIRLLTRTLASLPPAPT